MFDLPQHRYLANGRAGDALRLRLQLDLLERDDFLSGHVYALVDHTVRALAQRLYLLDLVDLTKSKLSCSSLIHRAYSFNLLVF